jgi:protein-S-isoprenylcysteine O-methyltransferase Ste14
MMPTAGRALIRKPGWYRPAGVDGSAGVAPPWDSRTGRLADRIRQTRVLSFDLPELTGRFVVATLFTILTVSIVANFLQTGRITGLLLLASEALVVVLTVIRRTAVEVDRTWAARLITAMSIAGPPLVRPLSGAAGTEDLVTGMLSAYGLALVVAAKISLGRSFGLMPANRGIVSSGLYQAVRHPIYFGYLVTHVAFLIANPSVWNVALLVAADAALVVRSLYEERTLRRDPGYAAYCRLVRWRLVPGLF